MLMAVSSREKGETWPQSQTGGDPGFTATNATCYIANAANSSDAAESVRQEDMWK